MPIFILITLSIICMPIDWPRPLLGGDAFTSLCWAVGISANHLGLAKIISLLLVRQLALGRDRTVVGKRYAATRLGFYFGNIAGLFFLAFVAGWGWGSRHYCTQGDDLLPGAELLTLLPYFVNLVGGWAIFYDVEKALGEISILEQRDRHTRGSYVVFNLRFSALVIFLPTILVVTQIGLLRWSPEAYTQTWVQIAQVVLFLLALFTLQSIFPFILGAKPMPPGPLYERLLVARTRLGIRFRGVYVWDTRHAISTALVTGLIPRFRYVIISDLLLLTLNDDEVEAVFGHEAGHVIHVHPLYYLFFFMLSLFAFGMLHLLLDLTWVGRAINPDLLSVIMVALTGVYFFIAFGFISRRCERQADLAGAKCVSYLDGNSTELNATGLRVFMAALSKVGEINQQTRGSLDSQGKSLRSRLRQFPGKLFAFFSAWQHSTISKRVEYLGRVSDDLSIERRFQRRHYQFRWLVVVGLLAALGIMLTIYGQMTQGRFEL